MANTRNYMFEFTMYSCLLLMRMQIFNCQESPCPRVFRYNHDLSNTLYGVITVPTPTNHNNLIELKVQLSIGNALKSQNSNNIQFLGTVDDIVNKRPLVYKLLFPFWNNIPPKITSISLNNQSLCAGEPVITTYKITTLTTVNLSFTLTVTTEVVNSGNNQPPMTENGNYGQNPPINIDNIDNNYISNNGRRKPPPVNNFQTNYPVSYPNQFNPQIPNVYPYDQRYYYPPYINTEQTRRPPLSYHTNHQNNNWNQISTTSTTPRNPPVKPVRNNNNFASCGKPMSSNPLVANGKDVQAGTHPWAGALFLKQNSNNPKYLCGASLITRKLALTAGHCVSKYSDANLYLVFGRINVNDWFAENDQSTKVDKAIIHPDYSEETSDADIAILSLSKELMLTSTVSPVCLWESDSNLKNIINEAGVVVGWGQNENYKYVNILQELYVPVVSEEVCLWSAEGFANITSNRTFCAGKNDTTKSGPCNGDSGSGFYFNLNGRWTIRGIVSRSLFDLSGRCDLKKYAVYLDVAKYIQWIHRYL